MHFSNKSLRGIDRKKPPRLGEAQTGGASIHLLALASPCALQLFHGRKDAFPDRARFAARRIIEIVDRVAAVRPSAVTAVACDPAKPGAKRRSSAAIGCGWSRGKEKPRR